MAELRVHFYLFIIFGKICILFENHLLFRHIGNRFDFSFIYYFCQSLSINCFICMLAHLLILLICGSVCLFIHNIYLCIYLKIYWQICEFIFTHLLYLAFYLKFIYYLVFALAFIIFVLICWGNVCPIKTQISVRLHLRSSARSSGARITHALQRQVQRVRSGASILPSPREHGGACALQPGWFSWQQPHSHPEQHQTRPAAPGAGLQVRYQDRGAQPPDHRIQQARAAGVWRPASARDLHGQGLHLLHARWERALLRACTDTIYRAENFMHLKGEVRLCFSTASVSLCHRVEQWMGVYVCRFNTLMFALLLFICFMYMTCQNRVICVLLKALNQCDSSVEYKGRCLDLF